MSTLTTSIVGAGAMSSGIMSRLTSAGHTVLVTDHDADKAAKVATQHAVAPGAARAVDVDEALTADVVVLAVWYPGTVEFATAHAETLAGKIVIDISNPLDSTYTRVDLPGDSSGAEQLAAAVPAARVVKAFNTDPAPTLGAGEVAGIPLDTFVASDDADAKRAVLDLLQGSGMRGLDAGALDNARVLERLTAFGIELGQRYGAGFSFGFKYLTAAGELEAAR